MDQLPWTDGLYLLQMAQSLTISVSAEAGLVRTCQMLPELVVESQVIDIAEIIYRESGDQTPSKRCVETGSQGLRGSLHLKLIGLPLNPMECVFLQAAEGQG